LTYELEQESIIKTLLSSKVKNVLLQLPDGLKPYGTKIAEELQRKARVTVIIHGDPCYGACDVARDEAKALGIDMIIHFGHTPMLKLKRNIIYVEARSKLNVTRLVAKALPLLKKYGSVGLAATVQHISAINKVKLLLKAHGIKVLVGKRQGLLKYDGQVLGCDFSTCISIASKVSAFLLIGSFTHALGLRIVTRKPVVLIDPYQEVIEDVELKVKKVLAKRLYIVQKCLGLSKFGIVIGLKPGQLHLELAKRLKDLLSKAGKNVFLISAREINSQLILNFPDIDCFVISACPFLPIYDADLYPKPVLTPNEALAIAGVKKLEEIYG